MRVLCSEYIFLIIQLMDTGKSRQTQLLNIHIATNKVEHFILDMVKGDGIRRHVLWLDTTSSPCICTHHSTRVIGQHTPCIYTHSMCKQIRAALEMTKCTLSHAVGKKLDRGLSRKVNKTVTHLMIALGPYSL